MDSFVLICIGVYILFCIVGFLKVDQDGDIRSWSSWLIFDELGVLLSAIGYIGFPGIILHKIMIKMKKKSDSTSEQGEDGSDGL